MNFFELIHDEKYKRVWWSKGITDFEQIICPEHKGHMRGGKRVGNLFVDIKSKKQADIYMTSYSEWLLSDKVVDVFRKYDITGYELKPVEVCNVELPYKLWEMVVTGWAGVAPEKSGIKLKPEECCQYCNKLRYTGLINPEYLIDENQWDGSDIFMVWPLPKFVFITEKVVNIINKEKLTGCLYIPLEELRTKNNSFGPGRLSYYMPEERARELGEPLGIY